MANAEFNPIDIQEAIAKGTYPTVVMWNRLEGRPRTHHFDEALKAEVRDALWMLTKQWQTGEFRAEDAGSPVTAKIHVQSSRLSKYKAGNGDFQELEVDIPLEGKVEQKKIPFHRNVSKLNIDIRLQMGQYWLRLLKKHGLDFGKKYIKKYSFVVPPKSRETDYIYAQKDIIQCLKAVSGRCLDGYSLYEKIVQSGSASDGITSHDPAKTKLDNLGSDFRKWFEKLYLQPSTESNNAWLPDRLEYQFKCALDGEKKEYVVSAEEYYNGHLDWYAFDLQENENSVKGSTIQKFTDSFIPSHVAFEGMPDTRWWKFEDNKTSFGDIKPSTTDISKLLLIEFGLVFANDWFLIPFTLPIGSLTKVRGLTVTNNFGETFWIESAEQANAVKFEWSLFKLHADKFSEALFLAPTATKVHEAESVEEVLLIRDEMSNMVWGIEKIVPTLFGYGANGDEYALQIRRYHESMIKDVKVPSDIPYAAQISYLAMTTVPENWIPFIPVHIKNHNRQVQLQRASMLRIIDGDPLAPIKIKPMTSILREGLENKPLPLPYYIHEEEVQRTGTKIIQSFQRTRWTNGEIFVWLGMKKKTGRGEGSSGLAFDQINYPKEESATSP